MTKNILYIHGFNSSPLSLKAEQTRVYLHDNHPNVNFYCPQLATTPKEAIAQLEQLINSKKEHNHWCLIGSSLGGYFASYLSENYNIPAVLVNPAVKPYELLHDYIGEHVNPYTQEIFQVTLDHIEQLKRIEQVAPSIDSKQKNNFLVMVQTDDEVLNYQQAVDKYHHCQLIVEQGGDHSFINFDKKLTKVFDFLLVDLNQLKTSSII